MPKDKEPVLSVIGDDNFKIQINGKPYDWKELSKNQKKEVSESINKEVSKKTETPPKKEVKNKQKDNDNFKLPDKLTAEPSGNTSPIQITSSDKKLGVSVNGKPYDWHNPNKNQQDQTSVLPRSLVDQVAIPATVNAARTGTPEGNERPLPPAPLRNEQKGNVKSGPYKRTASHDPQTLMADALAAGYTAAEIAEAGGPKAMALAGILGASAYGLTYLPDAIKRGLINHQVKKVMKQLNADLNNPNPDARVQQRILKNQAKMNELSPGKLAPGQDKLPADQQHAIIDASVRAANERGSSADYPGKRDKQGNLVNSQGQGNNGNSQGQGNNGNSLQLSRYTAPQIGLQNELINRLMTNPADFEAINQNEINRFKTETLPYINEQAFGRNALQSGSAQTYKLAQAGESLAEKLAAMKSKYALQQEGNYLQGALQPTFENIYTPPAAPNAPPKPFWQQVLQNAGPGSVEKAGKMFSNWWNKEQPEEDKGKDNSGTKSGTSNNLTDKYKQDQIDSDTAALQAATRNNSQSFQMPAQLSNLKNQNDVYSNSNNALSRTLQKDLENRTNYALGGGKR